jgi:hypothetical protein
MKALFTLLLVLSLLLPAFSRAADDPKIHDADLEAEHQARAMFAKECEDLMTNHGRLWELGQILGPQLMFISKSYGEDFEQLKSRFLGFLELTGEVKSTDLKVIKFYGAILQPGATRYYFESILFPPNADFDPVFGPAWEFGFLMKNDNSFLTPLKYDVPLRKLADPNDATLRVVRRALGPNPETGVELFMKNRLREMLKSDGLFNEMASITSVEAPVSRVNMYSEQQPKLVSFLVVTVDGRQWRVDIAI